ncbi:MAG: GerMN domain-containing protein [Treponema sp.]|nr:GerMN domain-containing protein [Treponema sp.]
MEYSRKVHYIRLSVFSLIIFLFLISSFIFLISNKKERRLFIFPSVDEGNYVVEYRYLEKNPVQGKIQLFVDELLLGSGIERTKLVFARGTRVLSCFLRKGVLFVNLSPELLAQEDSAVQIQEGVELLKKNIKANFGNVSEIEIYVDGKYAYE